MDRRQFVEKALRTSLLAAISGLGGCITPKTPSTGSNALVGLPSKSTSSTGQTFPPSTNPVATPTQSTVSTPPAGALNVRDYGAKGDGVTNDTDAFAAASDVIMKAGGGTLWIPAGLYIVGKQTYNGPTTQYETWSAHRIIDIQNCPQPVVVQGEKGTVLRAADGLRFGAFDPATGNPYTPPSMPFQNNAYLGDAYCMVNLINNVNATVNQLELDGNINGLILGGEWGDTGRQCDGNGIVAVNTGTLSISDVYTHHHGKDGLMIVHYALTPDSPTCPVTLTNVVSDSNARQGFSWTGGNGLTATNCKFTNTGQVRFNSAPAAGLDIEAENSVCRNGVFNSCEFSNTAGCCIVAEAGDSANLTFNNCTMWGTKSWALWSNKPYMTFNGCAIHGAIVDFWSPNGNSDAANKFVNCTIDNNPSPVYGPCYPYSGMVLGFGDFDAHFINTTITSNGNPVTPPTYTGA